MNILFVGDIFGSAGRKIVREHIGHVREAHKVDLTIMNVENAAGGFGVTPGIADDLFELGADAMTTGNHVWDKRELLDYLASVPADSHARARRILRPANMQPGLPGYGVYEGTIAHGPNEGTAVRSAESDGQGLYERHQRSVSRRQRSPRPG